MSDSEAKQETSNLEDQSTEILQHPRFKKKKEPQQEDIEFSIGSPE